MNKVLLISKSGEKIPFMIIRCESFDSFEWGFYIYRDNEKHILHVEWDYYKVIDTKNIELNIVGNFEQLVKIANSQK